jgi:hypothetical protein
MQCEPGENETLSRGNVQIGLNTNTNLKMKEHKILLVVYIELVGVGSAMRPCTAHTRLFGLIKRQNGELSPPPPHRSFAASLFF